MRFQVPQFIGVEDTLFGPFTAKQFVYIAGGGALCYLIYKLLPLFIAIAVMAPLALLSISLAFVKINGKPFVFILEAGLKYVMSAKLYLWKKETNPKKDIYSESEVSDMPLGTLPPTIRAGKMENLDNSLNSFRK
jgi:hypothetical protein